MSAKNIIIFLSISVLLFSVNAQEKPGSCSPPTGAGICAFLCMDDSACPGIQKCCPTGCGGTVCSNPMTRVNARVKPGKCPTYPTGPWVCGNTCSSDADCFGAFKCCPNRCKANTCTRPGV